MLSRERLRALVEGWRGRAVVSKRLLGTGIGILVVGIPFSLWFVVAGPTAGDRFVAAGFLVVCVSMGLYSLWEAKRAPSSRAGRGDGRT